MSDEMSQEAWEKAWERFRSLAGSRAAVLLAEGTIGWAVRRMLEGRVVRRKGWAIAIGIEEQGFTIPGFTIGAGDLCATDWELAETPDSPCDVP